MTGLDTLTGFPGRQALNAVQDEFGRRPDGAEWTFLMIDIDHFKLINDIYGHLVGDQVLSEVARVLQRNMRRSDVMIRFGGDEFLGIFRDTDTDRALNYSERVMDEIRKLTISRNIKPSLSIGLADSKAEDRNISALIDRADKALYNAKESGRGRISFASDPVGRRVQGPVKLHHFVGRRAELTGLRQLLDECVSEGSRFALIEGEAGVGKSRLASEMIHYAQFKRIRVLQGQCFEFGDSEPYAFVLSPVRDALKRMDASEIRTVREAVEPFHPATAEMFQPVAFNVSGDLQFFREERLKFRIFEDFAKLLAALSAADPVLFIIDDVQWMAIPDLEMLTFLVRSSVASRITFVTTMRTREKSTDPVRRHLQTLSRSVPLLHLRLSNLEKQETFNLIMFALKDPNIPQRALETIYRQCGGNPFFLEELLNSLIQSGSIKRTASGDWSYHLPGDLQLPESLAQLIEARLYPLSGAGRNYLRIAALSAGAFTVDMLCAASGDAAVDVIAGLEEPVQLGLIQCERGNGVTAYRFAHDTICSFLHRELSAAMKMVYHHRLARYFEEQPDTGRRDEIVVSMAYHYSQSDDRAKARTSALQAAHVFESRQANRDTLRWLETYMSFSDSGDDTREERFRSHVKLGDLYAVFGDWEKSLAQLDAAAKLVQNGDDSATLALKKGHVFQNTSRYGEARACYTEAFETACSPLRRVDALNSLAFLDYLAGDLKSARVTIGRADAILAETEADPGLLEKYQTTLCITRGVIKCAIMPGPDAVAEYETALTLSLKHGDLLGQATIYNNLSDIYSRTGRYEKALEALRKAEEIDTRLDDALNMAIVCYNTAILYSEINQPVPAREYFQRYADISRDINNELGIGYSNLGAGELFEEEGNLDKAEEAFRKAMDIFGGLGIESMELAARLNLVHLLILGDRVAEAVRLFEEGFDPGREILERDLASDVCFIRGLLVLGRGDGAGAVDEAEALMKRSLELGASMDVSFLMRRYYHLIDIQRRKGCDGEAGRTLAEARAILADRLSHIEKPHIRENICRKRYIRDILDDGIRDDPMTGFRL